MDWGLGFREFRRFMLVMGFVRFMRCRVSGADGVYWAYEV